MDGAGDSGYVGFDNSVVCWLIGAIYYAACKRGFMVSWEKKEEKKERKTEQRRTTATNYAGKKQRKKEKATLPVRAAALQFGRLFLTLGEKQCS